MAPAASPPPPPVVRKEGEPTELIVHKAPTTWARSRTVPAATTHRRESCLCAYTRATAQSSRFHRGTTLRWAGAARRACATTVSASRARRLGHGLDTQDDRAPPPRPFYFGGAGDEVGGQAPRVLEPPQPVRGAQEGVRVGVAGVAGGRGREKKSTKGGAATPRAAPAAAVAAAPPLPCRPTAPPPSPRVARFLVARMARAWCSEKPSLVLEQQRREGGGRPGAAVASLWWTVASCDAARSPTMWKRGAVVGGGGEFLQAADAGDWLELFMVRSK
ncbi:hypothetical protein I4F81_004314 [Pyropia yezoensis]|uniref:Uncharacterized protein n=1 Tax=Pyropia yezoensis TaxID=2788 RepID=A0ACC3BUY9_PYRYE|nr:hypothetical protein I4F81_004314 [Neopyropia yezoensis]